MTSTKNQPCDHCAVVIPHTWTVCPHCGRPARFPNVLIAESAEELGSLNSEYQKCRDEALTRGCVDVLDAFGEACVRSKAVFTCTFSRLLPIVTNQTQVYADFYALASLRCKTTDSSKNWDALRIKAETDLIEGDPRDLKILYASLSIDGIGLTAYGECTVTLREAMFGHRATVFPENSALYFEKNPGKPRAGMRASWQNRHKLCTIRYAGDVSATTNPQQFPSILLQSSPDGMNDRLIEVHVVGPVTIRTFEKICVPKVANVTSRIVSFFGGEAEVPRPDRMHFSACKQLCESNSVAFEGV